MISVEKYTKSLSARWNEFVRRSKNGTFLFCRGFMDYHADRFTDASLVFMDSRGRICGLLPASSEGATVTSHAGLTYGGLVIDAHAVQTIVDEMLGAALHYYAAMNFKRLVIKPVPYIYDVYPSDEILYSLFRYGAVLEYRCVSSALSPSLCPRIRQSRRGGIVRAKNSDVRIRRVVSPESEELHEYHALLSDVLMKRHKVHPVHSYEEMRLLMNRFPDEIALYVAEYNGEILAGSWVFDTPNVMHTQYLAANDKGLTLGAEDLLIYELISVYYRGKRWIDFGISTEDRGRVLNQGLIFQKEGFGARSVCYDTYSVDLTGDFSSIFTS